MPTSSGDVQREITRGGKSRSEVVVAVCVGYDNIERRNANNFIEKGRGPLVYENYIFVFLESKKFKRLKKAERDTEWERSGFSDEEEFDGSGKRGRTTEEKLKHNLFGDDEGAPLEDIAEEEEQPEEEDGDIGEEDEMLDFIVEEDEVDENGAPVRRKKLSKKKSLGRQEEFRFLLCRKLKKYLVMWMSF